MKSNEYKITLGPGTEQYITIVAYVIQHDADKYNIKICCANASYSDISDPILRDSDFTVNGAALVALRQDEFELTNSEGMKGKVLFEANMPKDPNSNNVVLQYQGKPAFFQSVVTHRPQLYDFIQNGIGNKNYLITNPLQSPMNVNIEWFDSEYHESTETFSLEPGEVMERPIRHRVAGSEQYVDVELIHPSYGSVEHSKRWVFETPTELLSLEHYGIVVADSSTTVIANGTLHLGGILKIKYPYDLDKSEQRNLYELIIKYENKTQVVAGCPTKVRTDCDQTANSEYRVAPIEYIALRHKTTKVIHYKTYCDLTVPRIDSSDIARPVLYLSNTNKLKLQIYFLSNTTPKDYSYYVGVKRVGESDYSFEFIQEINYYIDLGFASYTYRDIFTDKTFEDLADYAIIALSKEGLIRYIMKGAR